MTAVMKRPSLRVASLWLLVPLFSLALAACAQPASADIPTASENQDTAPANPVDTNPTPTPVDEADAAWVYAQCIRDNGYPEWPDPLPDGRIMLRRDQGMSFNDPRMQAAMEACQDLRPPGAGSAGLGGGMGQGFADEEAILSFAQCMRENGVPEFPDPSLGGGPMVIGPGSGINPLDPKFQAALRTCFAAVSGEDQ